MQSKGVLIKQKTRVEEQVSAFKACWVNHGSDTHFLIEFVVACSFWYMMITIPYIEATHGLFFFIEYHSDSVSFSIACFIFIIDMFTNIIVQQKVSDDRVTLTIKENFKMYFGRRMVFDMIANFWLFTFIFRKDFMAELVHQTFKVIY